MAGAKFCGQTKNQNEIAKKIFADHSDGSGHIKQT